MNLTLTNLNQPDAQARPAAAPATDAPMKSDVTGVAGPLPAAPAHDATQPAAAQPALAFAQWLGLEQMAPVAVDGTTVTLDNATRDADTPTQAEEQHNADAPLLGAMTMSMPLMPLAQATLLAAALPGASATKESAPAADTGVALPAGMTATNREGRAGLRAAAPALPSADAPAKGAPNATSMPMPLMPLMPSPQATLAALAAALPGIPAAKESAPAADTEVSLPAGTTASNRAGRAELAALPAAAPALPAAAAALPAAAPALPAAAAALPAADTPVQGAPNAASKAPALPAETLAAAGDTAGNAAPEQAAPATERGAANTIGVPAPAAGGAQRTAETVTLSGPPTAWRQTLQEALGERLQLQVGKNAEQAVIRLEPPMLGRVEIAIRHSAGSLDVHISATHGEVLRQLQTVSENLRSDLAQRQFTDVTVNVVPTARSANGAPMFAGGDGRGRQQDGQPQEQDPGNALAEANTGNSPFSLNGRGPGRGK